MTPFVLLGFFGLLAAPAWPQAEPLFPPTSHTTVITIPGLVPVPGGRVELSNLEIDTRRVIVLSPAPNFMRLTSPGESQAVEVTGILSDLSGVDMTSSDEGTTYRVSPSTVATDDATGIVTAVGHGPAILTITNGRLVARVFVAVDFTSEGQSLRLSPGALTFSALGAAARLSAILTYTDRSENDVTMLSSTTYSAANSTVASVNASGIVTALAPGQTFVTASYGGLVKASVPVFVAIPPEKSLQALTLSPFQGMLRRFSATAQLSVKGELGDGSVIDLSSEFNGTTYESSHATVAVVARSGLVTAIGSGITIITADNSGFSSIASVRVSFSDLQALAIAPSSAPITLNSVSPVTSQQLLVRGEFSDGTFEDFTSSATGTIYQTSDERLASPGPSGLVVFSQPGQARIVATNSGVSSTATFTVSRFDPIPLGRLSIPGANNVRASGAFAYVTTGGGLTVVETSNPVAPTARGSVSLGGSATDLAVNGNLVYVANGADVRIVDVSTPAAPAVAGTFATGGNVLGVTLGAGGTRLYVGDDQGLKVASLLDPRNPALLGSAPFTGSITGVAVGGASEDLVFVGRGNQVTVVDVSNPAAPSVRSSVPMTANGIAASGKFAYVAAGMGGVHIVDASNPSAPFVSGRTNITIVAHGVAARGGLVLTAEDIFVNSLPIFNVSNSRSPAFVGTIDFPGDVNGTRVDAQNFLVYLIGSGVLQIGQFAQEQPLVPPTVQLLQPLNGAKVVDAGVVQVSAQASAAIGVQKVEFLVNGVVQAVAGTPPFTASVRLPVGFSGRSLNIGARAFSLSNVASAPSQVAVDVVPDPFTAVQGRVINVFGEALPGVRVSLLAGALSADSDQNGGFFFPSVPTALGDITLVATTTVLGVPISASTRKAPVAAGVTDFGGVILNGNVSLAGSVSGTLEPLLGPFKVVGNVTVPSGQTLTLPAGVILKFSPGAGMTVNGTLAAAGSTEKPVVFTSLADDSIGGDMLSATVTTGRAWRTIPVPYDVCHGQIGLSGLQ